MPMGAQLIGRQRELTELVSGLGDAKNGIGSVFLVVGEPGIGKTRLVDEFGREAKSRGVAVVWGRSWEAGGAPAFWPWVQVFRTMRRDKECGPIASAYSEVLERLLPELRPAGAPAAVELDAASARFQLFDELWSLLRAVGEAVPLLVVLDDLHAADPSSLALLHFVARDVRSSRIVFVATCRDRDAHATDDVLARIRDIQREATFLPLRRFTLEEAAEAASQALAEGVPTDVVKALHDATKGNPLFLGQLLRLMERRGPLGASALSQHLPSAIGEAIRERFATIPELRPALEAAAVLGVPFDLSLVGSMSGLGDATLRTQARSAVAAGVWIEAPGAQFEFAHSLFREALEEDLGGQRRAELHRAAAEALEKMPVPQRAFGDVARHLLAAASLVGADTAMSAAVSAAERSLESLAVEDAAALLGEAVTRLGAELDDTALLGRALVVLTEARARSGDYDAALESCQRAIDLGRRRSEPELAARAALAAGAVLRPAVISRGLIAALEQALALVGEATTTSRVELLARLAAARQPAPNPLEPIAMANEAIALARTLGDPETLRRVLFMGGSALADLADPNERVSVDSELWQLSEAAGDVAATLRAHSRLFFDFLELGQVGHADLHQRLHEAVSERSGIPAQQWFSVMMRSCRAIWDGRFADSEDLCALAVRIAERSKIPEARITTIMHRACRSVARGCELGLDLRDPAVAVLIEDPVSVPVMTAFDALRRGDLVSARKHYDQVPRGYKTTAPAGRFLIDLAVHLGDREPLKWLFEFCLLFEDRMQSWGRVSVTSEGPTTWLLGMMSGALGRPDEARTYFDNALSRCEKSGNRPYWAQTAYEYAMMLHRAGLDRPRVAELASLGKRLATDLGMHEMIARYEQWLAASAAVSLPLALEPKTPTDAATKAPPTRVRLYRDGEVWSMETNARTIRLKDARGIQILSVLLESPHREFHVLTLMNSAVADGDAGEVIDQKAVDAYREHVTDMEAELAEAESFGDLGRAERLRRDLELVRRELAAGLGLGGRKRSTSSAAERARVNVQRRIRDAIRRVAQEDRLAGQHLDRSVRTGTFCAYEPD